MSVSRETSFSQIYLKKYLDKNINLNDLALTPYIIKEHPGSVVVVDDEIFDVVFGLLSAHNISNFCCLTNLGGDAPSGFVSDYDLYKSVFNP